MFFRAWDGDLFFAEVNDGDFPELVEFLQLKWDESNQILFSPRYSDEEDDGWLPLDEEARKIVNDIEKKLQKLNKTGQFLFALPEIQKYLEDFRALQKPEISQLYIDAEFRIFLTDYGNREAKMSHLTKAVYLLHLIFGKMDLEDLKYRRANLLNLYKSVSYRTDIERLEESVDRLLLNENNELFTHYSRIKSAFCKIMDDKFARNYYISGFKGEKKGLALHPDKIKFANPIIF